MRTSAKIAVGLFALVGFALATVVAVLEIALFVIEDDR